MLGCDQGCASCDVNSVAGFRQCIFEPINGGFYVKAWMVQPSNVMSTVYSDSGCTQAIAKHIVASGTCTHSATLSVYYNVADVGNGELLFGFNCLSDCSACGDYGATKTGVCTQVGTLWAKATIL